MHIETLQQNLIERFGSHILSHTVQHEQLTIEVSLEELHAICLALRDDAQFHFAQLIDVCGVDYLHYGQSEWHTHDVTLSGYSRGVDEVPVQTPVTWDKPRFAVVYHLLSLEHNCRLRVRVFPTGEPPRVVYDIWESANWFEREAFDLFGILFVGHPDLRRILTDYGFIGHPFRKDFPLIGKVEMRYDATLQRCVYEPVSIQPRTLVPKVIRDDNRYVEKNDG